MKWVTEFVCFGGMGWNISFVWSLLWLFCAKTTRANKTKYFSNRNWSLTDKESRIYVSNFEYANGANWAESLGSFVYKKKEKITWIEKDQHCGYFILRLYFNWIFSDISFEILIPNFWRDLSIWMSIACFSRTMICFFFLLSPNQNMRNRLSEFGWFLFLFPLIFVGQKFWKFDLHTITLCDVNRKGIHVYVWRFDFCFGILWYFPVFVFGSTWTWKPVKLF